MKKLFYFLVFVMLFSCVFGATSYSGLTATQFTNPSFNNYYSSTDISTYWPKLAEQMESDQCQATTDFLVTILPGGCSPAVVRSDLLEEQNVPVFCQLSAVQINPLIDVSSIKSISFKGNYPADVAGISFHPAKAAIRSYNTLLNSPTLNNVGYVVIVLKKQKNESIMAKNISGILTATMSYNAKNVFGVGSSEFYLETMNDMDWAINQQYSSFWNGRGLLRVEDIGANEATVAVMTQNEAVVRRITLKLGETSEIFYFPGFYCQAGMRLKLNSLTTAEDSVLINVDGTEMWVRKDSKILDGNCRVTSVSVSSGEMGTAKLSCSGKSFDLSLKNEYYANLSTSSTKFFNIGENVSNNWYLVYAGITGKTIGSIAPRTGFVVIINSSKEIVDSVYSDLATNIRNIFDTGVISDLNEFKKRIKPSVIADKDFNVSFVGSPAMADGTSLALYEVVSNREEKKITSGANANAQSSESYFGKGFETVSNLLDTYPGVGTGGYIYAEQALLREIQAISDIYGDRVEKVELLNLFLEKYPSSNNIGWVKNELAKSQIVNSGDAYKTVYAGNQYHSIGAVRFKSQDNSDKSFEMLIGNKLASNSLTGTNKFFVGNTINLSKIDNNKASDFLVVKEINANNVMFDVYGNQTTSGTNSLVLKTTVTLSFNSGIDGVQEFKEIAKGEGTGKYKLSLNDLTVRQLADVSIISEMRKSSEANFSFNIGVEKRLIKLSPEKANETADALNKTIREWEARNAKLGTLVEAWKGACLATGLGLQIKSFLTGFNGESIARPQVMDIYQAKCRAKKPEKSLDVCYNDFSTEINKDVDAYANAIQEVNKNVGELSLDEWKTKKCPGSITFSVNKNISCTQFNNWEDVRAYLINENLKDKAVSDELKQSVKLNMEAKLGKIYDLNKGSQELSNVRSSVPSDFADSVVALGDNNVKQYSLSRYQVITANSLNLKITDTANTNIKTTLNSIGDKEIGFATTNQGGAYKLVLIQNIGETSTPSVIGVYNITPAIKGYNITGVDNDLTSKIGVIAGQKCSFPYRENTAVARFYETEPNQGMPAVVPFDLKKGWYAYVSQTGSGLLSSAQQGYQESGAPIFFYVCNVGANGIENNKGGDDICQSFNSNNYASVTTFGGCALTPAEVQDLARRAERAIREAASQYQSGSRQTITTIDGKSARVDPASSAGSDLTQCQDFMNPQDCKLMFNVCDPVICPVSRCDFGGQYPVANVIQSGIIGSILLCSKNFVGLGGDVYVPICLTGVHAGIEGWISILKAEQTCLKDYISTGKHTGICDEMTAIYKCEFFWRQAQPLIKGLIPNAIEFLYTGGEKGFGMKRGGGEYSTFSASWSNMEKSMDYFKNTYASTSFTAFKFGDFATSGSELCRSFIGTSYPTSAKALDAMLKPESPPQFFGKFSEIKLTEATVPATSQYKVFYHIYAGTDLGASYTIYMKNPPSTSYYQSTPTVNVKSGYIAIGEQVSEAVDFSAPAGYKELCLVINNVEQCGFTSVSTDFAINAIHDAYVNEQANQTVNTEKECISGTASVLALANTNLEQGADNAINPNIALNGIVRVCASENPGKSTSVGRWKNIGNCGDSNLICWQDENSVNRDALNIVSGTGSIASATQSVDNPTYGTDIMTAEDSLNKLAELKKKVNDFSCACTNPPADCSICVNPIVELADNISVKGLFDSNKAEAMLWKAELYWKVLKILVKPSEVVAANPPVASTPSVSNKPVISKMLNNNFEINYQGSKIGEFRASGTNWAVYDLVNKLVYPVRLNQNITIPSGYESLNVLNGCKFSGNVLGC